MTHLNIPIRGDRLSMRVEVRAHLAHRVTPFQTIDVYETNAFGKALLLDGHIQLTELDEGAYHECLVQIPLLNLPHARSALVVGGGDGGVLRELTKAPQLERIDMVEIDAGVIEVCRETLPNVNADAFDDPRVTVRVADAFEMIKQGTQPYDLIIMDSTDVYEGEAGNLSEMLFTDAFYRDVNARLAPGGLVATQADNLVFCPYSLEEISATFARTFAHVESYFGLVPSFGGFSGFCVASQGTRLARRWAELPGDGPPREAFAYLSESTYNLAFSKLPFAQTL